MTPHAKYASESSKSSTSKSSKSGKVRGRRLLSISSSSIRSNRQFESGERGYRWTPSLSQNTPKIRKGLKVQTITTTDNHGNIN